MGRFSGTAQRSCAALRGRFGLARAPDEIGLREIIEGLEGPLSENLKMGPSRRPTYFI